MNWKFMMLAVAVVIVGLGAVAMAEDSEAATGDVLASGSCGTNLTYEIRSLNADDSQLELIIEGSGDMVDYASSADNPWYQYRSKLRSATLPEGMTRLGDYSFYNCEYMTISNLPTTLTSIGTRALSYVPLPVAQLPSGLTSIGNSAFYFAKNLTISELPSGLTTIGENAFNGTNIRIAKIPDGITVIEYSAFSQCRSITSLELPAGLTEIGIEAFYSDSYLTISELPPGLTTIGKSAFALCSKLALTSLSENLVSIGESAFYGCTSLALTNLPEGLMTIEKSAFKGCTSLALTSLPESLTTIRGDISAGAFENCSSLALTRLPSGLTSIGQYAFKGCTNLAISSIPAGVTRINSNVFENCTSITDLVIPDSVTGIYQNAFKGCTSLNSITMPIISYPQYNTGLAYLTDLTYSTYNDWGSSTSVIDSPQYKSRATLQSITFADDRIPAYALYGQNLDTLTITNASGDDFIGIYTSPTTRATTEDLTVTGLAAQIVRLADVSGSAELLDGGITTNDVTVGWNTTPQGYATGPVDASPEVLVYPAKLGEESPYSMLFSLIPLFAVLALLLSVVYAFSTYAKREGAL